MLYPLDIHAEFFNMVKVLIDFIGEIRIQVLHSDRKSLFGGVTRTTRRTHQRGPRFKSMLLMLLMCVVMHAILTNERTHKVGFHLKWLLLSWGLLSVLIDLILLSF